MYVDDNSYNIILVDSYIEIEYFQLFILALFNELWDNGKCSICFIIE